MKVYGKSIDYYFNKLYGNWTVLQFSKKINGTVYVKCKCSCGTVASKSIYTLLKGESKSCGCLFKSSRVNPLKEWIEKNGPPRKYKKGKAALNRLYGVYRYGSRRKSLEFTITKEEFQDLIKLDCYYCGNAPNTKTKYKDLNGNIVYNGLDRVDNKIGYTIDNVVPCCSECNYFKKAKTHDEFMRLIERIYKHEKKKIQ